MAPRTIQLGDRTVTRVGLGTNRLTDTPANRAFLRGAVDAGIELIDTAHLYTGGASESTIGAALAPFPDNLVVATKGGYHPGEGSSERLREQLDQSFERLRTDTIALYYLHRVDPQTPFEETLGVLAEYREAGRIEQVGLSEVGVAQIEAARAVCPIAAVQNEYNLGARQWDAVIDHCAGEGIVFVPFYPLHDADGPAVREIAERLGATPHQVALAWLLRRSPATAPIPGTLSIDHVRENLAALDLELSDDDYERLTAA
jgi:aryl-alcohol dehydrogenase-like predicted oxidoreductase